MPSRQIPSALLSVAVLILLMAFGWVAGQVAPLEPAGVQARSVPQVVLTGTGTPQPTPTPNCGLGGDYVIEQFSFGRIAFTTDLVPGSQCDDCVASLALPFTFYLYGQPFSSALLGSNGTLAFSANTNPAANTCLPSGSLNNAIFLEWDDLDMSPGITNTFTPGIYTSMQGTAPNRQFNIEWRTINKATGDDVNFEILMYEALQGRFELVYGQVSSGGDSATVGVQRLTGSQYTQFSCNTGSLFPGLLLNFYQPVCTTPTRTPTVTPTRTSTPTFGTTTPTRTPTTTLTPTATATAWLVGHVEWDGRPVQPDPLQRLPITLTLKSGTFVVDFPQQTTDASGFFTVPVAGLPDAAYQWRVQGPDSVPGGNTTPGFLAAIGAVTLEGAPFTQVEMGFQRGGDATNDNVNGVEDFNLLKNSFGRSCADPGFDPRVDFNGDCVVDVSDFDILKRNFGQLGPGPISPERR